MDRRSFLKSTALGVGGLIAASVLPFGATRFGSGGWIAQAAPLETGAKAGGKRVVVVFLRGAVDGLNVVVPYGDPAYYDARRSIAIQRPGQANGVLPLDATFGLHPALAAVQPLWQSGSLAFVQASGSPDPTRSHFDAQIYMESGTPGRSGTADGWMNRLLATLPGPRGSTDAIAFGPTVSRILTGSVPVANVGVGAAAGKPLIIDKPEVNAAFSRLYGGTDAMSQTFRESQDSRKQVSADLGDFDDEQKVANGGAPLPNGFPGDAARLARMMRQDPSIRLAFLALGGWDTHVNQGGAGGQLAGRLKPLADGLAVLARDLGPAYKDTLVIVMSEFGRTVHENGNGGTDHGHGNVMWVMGGDVAGGRVYGQWPGLGTAQLYQQRDLAVTTDFRNVLAPALARHLALPDATLAKVFPQMPSSGALSGIVRA